MTYQEISDNYRNPEFRNRAEVCIKEQAMIFTADGRAEIAALGTGVVAGNWTDIDAVMSAVATGPNGPTSVTDDGALLAAVQSSWPAVAAARYPQLVGSATGQVIGPFGQASPVAPTGPTYGNTLQSTALTGPAAPTGPTGIQG